MTLMFAFLLVLVDCVAQFVERVQAKQGEG
jgi:hypothetical protein